MQIKHIGSLHKLLGAKPVSSVPKKKKMVAKNHAPALSKLMGK